MSKINNLIRWLEKNSLEKESKEIRKIAIPLKDITWSDQRGDIIKTPQVDDTPRLHQPLIDEKDSYYSSYKNFKAPIKIYPVPNFLISDKFYPDPADALPVIEFPAINKKETSSKDLLKYCYQRIYRQYLDPIFKKLNYKNGVRDYIYKNGIENLISFLKNEDIEFYENSILLYAWLEKLLKNKDEVTIVWGLSGHEAKKEIFSPSANWSVHDIYHAIEELASNIRLSKNKRVSFTNLIKEIKEINNDIVNQIKNRSGSSYFHADSEFGNILNKITPNMAQNDMDGTIFAAVILNLMPDEIYKNNKEKINKIKSLTDKAFEDLKEYILFLP